MDLTNIAFQTENLDPKLWGRNTWEFLEMIVITYPENDPSQEKKDAVYNLLESLGELLPCERCRTHYKEFCNTVSWATVLSGRAYLYQFYYDLRKDVSTRSLELFGKLNKEEAWKRILQKFHLYIPTKNDNMRSRMVPLLISKPGVVPRQRKKIVVPLSSGCNCGK